MSHLSLKPTAQWLASWDSLHLMSAGWQFWKWNRALPLKNGRAFLMDHLLSPCTKCQKKFFFNTWLTVGCVHLQSSSGWWFRAFQRGPEPLSQVIIAWSQYRRKAAFPKFKKLISSYRWQVVRQVDKGQRKRWICLARQKYPHLPLHVRTG